ncbi:pollen receptor-like kinase 3 [Phalaenopsis equestris]|uniref:pollen receptor-like kinase 3 n=1 Tax=Phalaenopsis equestris TaxID=78828 RepID=UPI0009E5025F|nr:pollen receptor-like kinase 3 [Phalaenopsis equestris]
MPNRPLSPTDGGRSSSATMAVVLIPLLLLSLPPLSLSLSDTEALLLLKSSFQNSDLFLSSWSADSPNSSSPCGLPQWTGVLCFNGIITGLRLRHLNLIGTINIEALTHFPSLRTLSFINNSLSGALPDFSRLDKLWINDNDFSGPIPFSLSKVKSLLELHIEGNGFNGEMPDLKLPFLRSFNASNNELRGPIPVSLARFGVSAFEGNEGLCGQPMSGRPCPEAAAAASPASEEKVITPAPAGVPELRAMVDGRVKGWHVVGIVVGVVLVLVLLAIGFVAVKRRRKVSDLDSVGGASSKEKAEASPGMKKNEHKRYGLARGSGSVAEASGGGGSGAVLVMVNSERAAFALPDLMQSAAEVLGNGSLGSAYKAVMAGGFAVVVKRMRELSRLNKELFDGEMRRFGRLNHPNVLTPLAYNFRKEEKLIVYDYVPKGSLLYVLHGDRGMDRAALDWPTRLKIILGIARGMAYLHAELISYEVPHGNLKTANVLLSPTFDPLLADYGLIAFINPDVAPSVLFSFKAPEAQHLRHVSPKSDVFCFGVVLLEILTGKFPSQYVNNTKGGTDVVQWTASAISDGREAELIDPAITGGTAPATEMVRLLRVGAACTQISPDERPEMKEAAELVEEIAAAAAAGAGGCGGGGLFQPSDQAALDVETGIGSLLAENKKDELVTRRVRAPHVSPKSPILRFQWY